MHRLNPGPLVYRESFLAGNLRQKNILFRNAKHCIVYKSENVLQAYLHRVIAPWIDYGIVQELFIVV